MINMILSIVLYKNKLAIGRNNELLFRFKHDMEYFKQTTMGHIVLMGYNTYLSLPKKPLTGRLNFVLTHKTELYNIPENNEFNQETTYFMSYNLFFKIYSKWSDRVVFVIGGSQIYELFGYRANHIYITDIRRADNKEFRFETGNEPDTFFDLSSKFRLVSASEKHFSENGTYYYRFLKYDEHERSQEYQYFDLMKNITSYGNIREDRTEIGTFSIFGTQMRFDISQTIPLMTSKHVPFRIILEELLWFCRGDTDAKILKRKRVNIWDGNTSREFLDKQGLTHYDEGVLGAGYGFQWRHFGSEYKQEFADSSKVEDTSGIGGFDQLNYVEHLLKTDPFSRRIVLSAWNPTDFDKVALPPCHILLQFYVQEINGEKYLSSQFYMRSNDVFLASVFNIVSYSILTCILALKCDMKPKEIVYTCGDTHIYKNHLQQVMELVTRKPRPFPKLILNPSLKSKDWSEMTEQDFELVGYYPHSVIRAEMAI